MPFPDGGEFPEGAGGGVIQMERHGEGVYRRQRRPPASSRGVWGSEARLSSGVWGTRACQTSAVWGIQAR